MVTRTCNGLAEGLAAKQEQLCLGHARAEAQRSAATVHEGHALRPDRLRNSPRRITPQAATSQEADGHATALEKQQRTATNSRVYRAAAPVPPNARPRVTRGTRARLSRHLLATVAHDDGAATPHKHDTVVTCTCVQHRA